MKIAICTICLNELEWLPALYEQHRDWPDMVAWVFVEGADRVYADTNPDLVSKKGLSVDGTSDYLSDLQGQDDRVTYIPHGFSNNIDPAACKAGLRQRYLDVLQSIRPDYMVILDADEFYCHDDQPTINDLMNQSPRRMNHFSFSFTHIWRPPSIAHEPLFSLEVVGGFFEMDHLKGHRWSPRFRYSKEHQRPDPLSGRQSEDKEFFGRPKCLHLAFSSNGALRIAKHRYYQARGEGRTDKRGWYVQTREVFKTWTPGQSDSVFPNGARVIPYTGPIPEVFINEQ